MNWKSFFDNKEEFFIGAFLQFPLFFIVRWWIVPIMVITAILWRLGGWEHGDKLWRRIGVPLVVCGSSMFFGVSWTILLAVPFMVWLAPSYGKESWLYKLLRYNDFVTRLVCFLWYWTAFSIAFLIH